MIGPTIRRMRTILMRADRVRVGAVIFQSLYDELKAAEDEKYPWLRNSFPDIALPNLAVAGKPVILDPSLPAEATSWVSYT